MIDQVLDIGKRWYYSDKLNREEIKMLRDEYRKHSGKTLGTCPSCYVEAYLFLKNLKTNKMEKTKTQFGLPSGKQIQMHGLSEVITEHNLTDALAFSVLKIAPNAIKLFSRFPEDWKKQTEAFDPLKEMRKSKKSAEVDVVSKAINDSFEESEEEITDPENENESDHEKRLAYDKMTKLDLQAVASSMELPDDEWVKKNKKHLIDYLIEKGS